ncbi:MAG: hypothetical protein R6V10_03610 [bacterium]
MQNQLFFNSLLFKINLCFTQRRKIAKVKQKRINVFKSELLNNVNERDRIFAAPYKGFLRFAHSRLPAGRFSLNFFFDIIPMPARRIGQLKACDPSAEAGGVCSGEGPDRFRPFPCSPPVCRARHRQAGSPKSDKRISGYSPTLKYVEPQKIRAVEIFYGKHLPARLSGDLDF